MSSEKGSDVLWPWTQKGHLHRQELKAIEAGGAGSESFVSAPPASMAFGQSVVGRIVRDSGGSSWRQVWWLGPPQTSHSAHQVRDYIKFILWELKKKASPPSQTLLKSAMSHVCPWLYSFQGIVFLCPWKCMLNINTAFSVTFDQFNDYTIFNDTFCCYVLNPDCSYLPFFWQNSGYTRLESIWVWNNFWLHDCLKFSI